MRAALFRFGLAGPIPTCSPCDPRGEFRESGESPGADPSADILRAQYGWRHDGEAIARRRSKRPRPVQRLYSTPETLAGRGLFGGPWSGRQMLLGLTIRMLAAAP